MSGVVWRQSDEQGDPPKGKEWELTTDEDDEHGYGNVFDIRPVASFVIIAASSLFFRDFSAVRG